MVGARVEAEIHRLAAQPGVLAAGPFAHQDFHVVESEQALVAELFGAAVIVNRDQVPHGAGPQQGGSQFAAGGQGHQGAQGLAGGTADGEILVGFHRERAALVGDGLQDVREQGGRIIAQAAAADHMVFEVVDFLEQGFALAFAGEFDRVEAADDRRRQAGFLFHPFLRADVHHGGGPPLQIAGLAEACLPARHKGSQGGQHAGVFPADGGPPERVEKLLALVAGEGVAENLGEQFVGKSGGARPFQQVEPAAGEAHFILETADDFGEKPVHRAEGEARQGADHPCQGILEIRVRQVEGSPQVAGHGFAAGRRRQFSEDGVGEFAGGLAGKS